MTHLVCSLILNTQDPAKNLASLTGSREIGRDTIVMGREIGSGEFGEVFEGLFRAEAMAKDSTQVAIKTLKAGCKKT